MKTASPGTPDLQAALKAEIQRERTFSDAMLNSMPGILYLYDAAGHFLRWNRRFEQLTGRTAEEIDTIHPLDFFDGSEKDLVASRIAEVLEKGESSVEASLIAKDGRRIPCLFTGVRVEIEGRTCIIGVGIDISARKQAEAEREASEARYRALFEQAPDGIVIADANGRYLDANIALCRMLGYTREELIGKDATDIAMPEETQYIDSALQTIKKHDAYSREWRFRRKDGSVVPADVMGTMMPDGNVMGIIRDITERKRVEEERQESEERFRATFEQAAVGIAHVAINGSFLRVNNKLCEITGYSREEMLQKTFWDLTPPEFRADDAEAVKAMLTRTRSAYSIEKQYQRRDGTAYWVSIISTLLWDAEGAPKYFIAVTADITARRQLEEQFLRSQRMESLGALASGIAHDLNNLLTPVLMGAELLRLQQDARMTAKTITTIESSALRGAELVKQLLSFARGTRGARMTVQVGHVIREMQQFIQSTFPRNVTFKAKLPKDLWPVQGDPTQLNQVLLNLCVNARDAMPDGGSLTVTARNVELDEQYAAMQPGVPAGRYLQLETTDTGSGIPPAVRDRIFEPFFTTKEPGKGTGLGLSTVREIVRSHGGHITLTSQLGKGTRFQVLIPAAPDAKADSVSAVAARPPRGKGETIMVVESDAAVLDCIARTLEEHGYQPLSAQDGAGAIALYAVRQSSIAATLVDQAAPLIGGASLVRVLRRINPDARIIATTGLADEAERIEGVSEILRKPYAGAEMLLAIDRVLGSS